MVEPNDRARLILARNESAAGRRPRGRRFQRVLRGVYLPAAEQPSLAHRCAAALLIAPADAIVTGVTALWLHGAEIGNAEPIRLASASGSRCRVPGVRSARIGRLPASTGRVASPMAAWSAACAELELVDAVAAADRLLRLKRLSLDDLAAIAATATGRGSRTVRRAAGLARHKVASPRETRLRLMLVLAGLPEPRCNVSVGDEERRIAEVDLLYDSYRLVIEYEGEQHRTDRWQWSADIERAEALAAAGYTLIRVTAARMLNPRALTATIFDHLRARGYADRRPTFTAEWRALFEGSTEWSLRAGKPRSPRLK